MFLLSRAAGGAGREGLRNFYAKHFIPKMPDDVKITPLERNVGQDASGGETVGGQVLVATLKQQ